MKLLARRAYQDALPTRKGLSKRVSRFDAICGVCNRVEEKTLHAIQDCSLVTTSWLSSKFEHVLDLKCGSLLDWWEFCLEKLDKEEMEKLLTLCRAV